MSNMASSTQFCNNDDEVAGLDTQHDTSDDDGDNVNEYEKMIATFHILRTMMWSLRLRTTTVRTFTMLWISI